MSWLHGPVVTHYALLGVSPDATGEEIGAAFERGRRTLVRRQQAGPSPQLSHRATQALDLLADAWAVLGDPGRRREYDQRLATSSDSGPGEVPPRPGTSDGHGFAAQPAPIGTGESRGDAVLAGIEEVAAWLGPGRGRSRQVLVPDLRGLPVTDARYLAAKAGVRTNVVQLALDPAPVEGRVVNQEPSPGTRVPRDATVVLDVLHPEA